MTTQTQMFEEWRKSVPPTMREFVSDVCTEIIPLLTAREFIRLDNYGGAGGLLLPSRVAMQRQLGDKWLTIELNFSQKSVFMVSVHFSWLSNDCYERTKDGPTRIDRSDAIVENGQVFFTLCKGVKKHYMCAFGCGFLSFFKRTTLRNESCLLRERIIWLLDVAKDGPPQSWFESRSSNVDNLVWRGPTWEWNDNRWSVKT